MQKATQGGQSGEVIAVSVVSFGNDPIALALPVGATVGEALTRAGVVRGTNEVFCSGESAVDADTLEAGDVLSIVSPKQAGKK